MPKLGAIITFIALTFGGVVTANALAPAPADMCWVEDELLMAADCQAVADASWEGLSMKEQQEIIATGLQGTALDQLVIDYRQTVLDRTPEPVEVQIGEPVQVIELPRTE